MRRAAQNPAPRWRPPRAPRPRALAVLLGQGEAPPELAHHLLKRPRRDPRAHLAALSLLDRVARTLLPHPLPPRSSTSRIVRAYVSHRKDRRALLLPLSAPLAA